MTVYVPSRSDVIGAIEAGIAAAGDRFSEDERERLRKFGRKAKEMAFEIYVAPNGCKCPTAAVNIRKNHPGYEAFTKVFDSRMREIIGFDPETEGEGGTFKDIGDERKAVTFPGEWPQGLSTPR